MLETKETMYDELCCILTQYENGEADAEDLYRILVKIQNVWDEIKAGE